jgi:(4-(4-[2-(gamma-L-glutamylamino)ethyl]phenoxymethyl)furan-2-yl)methanamine synthase
MLSLDIGGANLKAADGLGFAAWRSFPLWQRPEGLADALADLLAKAPATDRLAVTMTGELADCFETKAEGVGRILAAVEQLAAGRSIFVYLTDGSLVSPDEARRRPLEAAASNWHALARFAGRQAPAGAALLADIGSTTCDFIPIVDGQPATTGKTDRERLASGELVYTGVVRSPVCAVVAALPWRRMQVPVAQELFATTYDAYLILGDLPEAPGDRQTADGRAATRQAARDRLARSICADRESFSDDDAHAAAAAIARTQLSKLAIAAQGVVRRMPQPPATFITAGQGEFVARRLIEKLGMNAISISLAESLGPDLSRVAPAHALAVLAREHC